MEDEKKPEVKKKKENPVSPPLDSQSSPRWKTSTKRLAITSLLVLTLLAIYSIRSLLLPIIMAMVLGYVILPIVDGIHRHTRLSRNLSIAIVYLVIVTILIAIPVTTIATAI